jgi:hypothetical protein
MPTRARDIGAAAPAVWRPRHPAAKKRTKAAAVAIKYDIKMVCTLHDPNCEYFSLAGQS